MMRIAHRSLLACCLGASWGMSCLAAEIALPRIVGNLSGDFKPFEFAAAPTLHWSVTLRDPVDGSEARVLDTQIDGEGAHVRGTIYLANREDGSWEMAESEFDLATWLPLAQEKTGEALRGLVVAGTVQLKGTGAIKGGAPSGTVQVTLKGGRVGNAEEGWALDGVTLTAELFVEANPLSVRSTTPFELAVGTITTKRLGARNVFARGVLKADRTVALSEARVEIAGGEIKVDPTILTLSPLAVEATLHILNVGMQDIVALVPAGLSSARGRIDGTLRVGWSVAEGIRVGAGELDLGLAEPAVVQLAPAPGFLTGSLPKRFAPIPSWLGPISRWLSADNPVYTNLEEIELGHAALAVQTMKVRLTPEGDERGRTATIQMTAHPADPKASVKAVNFDVNVAGPLDSILKLGLNRDLSIQTR